MKRYIHEISTKSSNDYSEDLFIELSDIENKAYRLGYELTVSNMQVFLVCKKNQETMPEIFVTTVPESENVFTFTVKLRFPELDSANDDVMSIVNKWNQLYDLIDELILFTYTYTDEELD